MDNKDKYIFNKIYTHIVSVLKYCEDSTSLDEFNEDKKRVEACVFNLMQIGKT